MERTYIDVKCDVCGKILTRVKGKAKRGEKIVCSEECHSKLLSHDKPKKEKLDFLYNQEKLTQKEISEIFNVSRTTVAKWMKNYEIKSRKRGPEKGSDNKEIVECEECGKNIKRWPCEQYDNNFCSKECYDNWQTYRPKNNRSTPKYGHNWKKQRKNCLERDNYSCQVCDSKNDLLVHHKRPVRTFDKTNNNWYKIANKPNNLLTMCRSCHSKIHGKNSEKQSDLVILNSDSVSESDHGGE